MGMCSTLGVAWAISRWLQRASAAAIRHLQAKAQAESLDLQAECTDLRDRQMQADYDSVVSIGLLMFFDCPTAFTRLEHLKGRGRPGGVAGINVLTLGTIYLDMFSTEGHCLFAPDALLQSFAGWRIESHESAHFSAPGGTQKSFVTVMAYRLH
jgi:tellurite methyltransferase